VKEELRTRKREMRGYSGNHYEALGLSRFLWACQLTIPVTVGPSPNQACNYTVLRPSQPNQASHTLDFLYRLISSTLYSFSFPISLFLIHNSTIIAKYTIKSSFSISHCHDHELAPSAAYTRYSIHPRLFVFPVF
jgi:hypothetical protein